MTHHSRPRHWGQALRWLDLRHRQVESWAFIANRLSGLGLTLYLFLHLAVLSLLASGPEAYDSFVKLAKSPLMVAGELLVVIAGLYHGLNGLRLAATSIGIGIGQQKLLLIGLVAIVVVGGAIFALRMF
jgi:succinate dehydrogenase / fumarate reductase, cytochrome b subunit